MKSISSYQQPQVFCLQTHEPPFEDQLPAEGVRASHVKMGTPLAPAEYPEAQE